MITSKKLNSSRVRRSGISSRNRLFNVSAYVGIIIIVLLLIVANIFPSKSGDDSDTATSQTNTNNFVASSTLPIVTSNDAQIATIASVVADSAELNSYDSASNRAITMNAIVANSQTNVVSASKPASYSIGSSAEAISSYTVQAGDTAASIAAKFGISDQTLREANNLSSDAVSPGEVLSIPAVDGVIYTTTAGDTLASIAAKYNSTIDNIISVNNLVSEDVPVGTRLLLPDGKVPVTTTTGNSNGAGTTSAYSSELAAEAGNRYYYGECTWYAYNRRVELGLPVGSFWGNANTWAVNAAAAGYLVNHTPSVGAIFQTTAGYYGHVAIVESVNSNGTITISEMNYTAWAKVDTRVVSNPSSYSYIQ